MALRNPVAYPLLASACLFLVLIGIAATIVLALIPIYISSKAVTPASNYAKSRTLVLYSAVDDSVPLGDVSDAQKQRLQAKLESSLSADERKSGAITLQSGTVTNANGARKRAITGSRWLKMTIIVFGRNDGIITVIARNLVIFINSNTGAINIIVLEGTTTTASTTAGPVSTASPVSTSPGGGRRRRKNADGTTSSPLVTYRD